MIVGLINIAPAIVFLDPAQSVGLYGLAIEGDSLLVLIRHRGILLGLVGIVLIFAAFRKEFRQFAIFLALISKVAFFYLVFGNSEVSEELVKVAWIDVVAVALLATGGLLHLRETRSTEN